MLKSQEEMKQLLDRLGQLHVRQWRRRKGARASAPPCRPLPLLKDMPSLAPCSAPSPGCVQVLSKLGGCEAPCHRPPG